MNGTAPLIEVEHLTMRFGGLIAVDDVSFIGRPREITAIIGPNGAGKTTVLDLISGFVPPTSGRVVIEGQDVTSLSPDARAVLGLAYATGGGGDRERSVRGFEVGE